MNFSTQNIGVVSKKAIKFSEIFISSSVALSLFGGRWISYIGLPKYNLFLIDFLYFLGLAGLLIFQKNRYDSKSTFFITFILLIFIAFQFFRSNIYSPVTRLRDLIPFLYLLASPIIVARFSINAWATSIKLIRFATLLGAIWTNLVMIGILKEISLSPVISGVPVFSARWDHSGISICVGILLWGRFPRANLNENVLIRVFLVLSLLLQYSRASYVGLFFVLMSIFVSTFSKRNRNIYQDKLFIKSCIALFILGLPILVLVAPLLPEKSALSRIGVENIFSPQKIVQETRSSGTANARIEAQKLLKDWIYSHQLQYLGAGPGREMVLESNAYQYLSGARDVRSPHSWLYGNFARFGYLGIFVWHFFSVKLLLKQADRSKVLGFPANILIMIYLIALFGVIMESPFGILPFSFFLGGAKLSELSNER